MEREEYLKRLGLSKKQRKILYSLSKHKESSVVEISTDTKIPRSSIYLELDRLEEMGFAVSVFENGVRRYKLSSRDDFRFIVQGKYKTSLMLLSGVDSFLDNFYDNEIGEAKINVYRTKQGIKQLLWKILVSEEKELLGFSPGTLEDVTDHKFAEEWRAEFQARGMINRIILNDTVPMNWSDIPNFLSRNVKAKTLKASKIQFEREVLIYGDTLVLISKKDTPDQYGIEIKDKLLVDSYKQLFNFLWDFVAK